MLYNIIKERGRHLKGENGMKKLSTTQQKVLNKIRNEIAFAKQFNNFKDFWMAEEIGYARESEAYEELKALYEERYINYDIEKTYKKFWLNELNNITLTICSSSTLRALENQGYIEIIHDAGLGVDTVKLIKFED